MQPKLYVAPSWHTTHWRPEDITDEQLKIWKEETILVIEKNRAIHAENMKKFAQLFGLVRDLFGTKSIQEKYLLKNDGGYAANWHSYSLNFKESVEDKVNRCRAEAEKIKKTKESEKEQLELLAEAVLWLKARGRALGLDFSAENAIQTANDIAFFEEVERRREYIRKNGPIGFSGQNCDGPCSGWDGESKRCECGNRRVSWTYDDLSFKDPSIYGEAY